MPVLTSAQRSALESVVVSARKLAETGARHALHALAIDEPEPYVHMTPDQRALRNRLRYKARLLGDALQDGRQDMDKLGYELAYEYWHRMLFAKFLEANHLLMHPDGVAVSMAECEELAPEEGYVDKWEAAAAYASRMLPAIFRPDDPLMQVHFATEDRIKLETLLDQVSDETFTADDSLGWVYQFWQNEAKAAINASGDKIDGKRLPAVTQLFTEPYMVNFLIDNTLGAWWISRNPGAESPVVFEYLRTLDDGTPAAGNFEGWPDKTADLTALDPCMGSGHFVCSLFCVLVALRMHEEGLSKEAATDKVITENLHGLELDPRCTQIAAFNLALTAWKFCGEYRPLPEMNLACSGLAPKGKREDWMKLVARELRHDVRARMENGMAALYDLFQQAPELGSLIDPATLKPDAFTASFEELQPYLAKALEKEADQDVVERGVMAAGIAAAARLLSKTYTLQITNVPYLARGKQDKPLANYCLKHYPDAKGDLATVFLDRMLKNTQPSGTACSVMPQNWLFLTSYKKFRVKLLQAKSWDFVAKLGEHAFEDSSAAGAFAALICVSNRMPMKNEMMFGVDVSANRGQPPIYASEKAKLLRTVEARRVQQVAQLGNPDARVVIEKIEQGVLLSNYAKALQGIATGDFSRFGRLYWEIDRIDNAQWIFQQTTFNEEKEYTGKENIIFWENGTGALVNSSGARIQGLESLNSKGVAIAQMALLGATINLSTVFDNNSSVIIPFDEDNLLPIWSFCSSPNFNEEVRKIDQKVSVTNATLVKVPFDLTHWQKVATEKYPNGLPQPYSDDPTQWLFHGHPVKAERPLQVALARLLGYRWPAESDEEMELSEEARRLIREVQAFNYISDEDGIVCLPPVNGEHAATERLREFLQAVYGPAWSNHTLAQLLAREGSSKTSLEDWLREEFFEQHHKLFHHRPFLWHIWDGRRDGFSAIVNYHQLTKDNLSKLIYTYLGDWLRQCEAKLKSGESGAEGLLSAARQLQKKLLLILEGEPPYDIFVRWKPLHEQPLGWDPDLNDGVRLNIRPFMEAGVLRKKPNIKWGVDRGKNPEGSHWGPLRDNDRHLTLEEKRVERVKLNLKN